MFNANNLPTNSNFKRPDPLEAGSYPARLVQVVVIGIQKERPFKGEQKDPRLYFRLTYEMLDEFLKDEDGEDILTKPRWISEELPFLSLRADRAKSTARYLALDPQGLHKGAWDKLVGTPCMVTVIQDKSKQPGNDRIYEKIAAVSSMRPKEAEKAPALVNPTLTWSFYEPDIEVFNKFPAWLRDKIQSAEDFPGGPLDLALGGGGAPAPKVAEQAPQAQENASVEGPASDEEDW